MGSIGDIVKLRTSRPHAVCVPCPAQGHITPMLKLAKLLHHKGFHITFVNTHFNHNRLLRSQGPDALNGLPSFQFTSIPDGLPPSDADSTQDVVPLLDSTTKHCLGPFRDLIVKLNGDNSIPPVTCIVSDLIMSFTLDVSHDFGIPNVLFWTASVSGLVAYSCYSLLIEKGLIPLKDLDCLTNGYLDTVLDGIPGLEGIRLKDIPTFVRTTDVNDFMIHFCIEMIGRARGASAVVFNTYDALEDPILMDSLSSILPPMYPIGPVHQLAEKIQDKTLNSIQSNLWKDQPECLEWLDSNEPNSVIYVNFGSITVMTNQQLVEFAWGLANSHKKFLWIIRPDLVTGEDAILPQEFVSGTRERSLMAGWCQQELVLSHPSIAGFLTHCGWNSTVESISAGVPMICWPFFSEQQTNCWYCCNKWGIGMEMDSDVSRDRVEKLVVELMESEKGRGMKKKVTELKNMAEEAVGINGSSQVNLDKLIRDVLL